MCGVFILADIRPTRESPFVRPSGVGGVEIWKKKKKKKIDFDFHLDVTDLTLNPEP